MTPFLVSIQQKFFVVLSGKIFQHTIGFPMSTNVVPLLADMFYTHTQRILFKVTDLSGRGANIISVQVLDCPDFENYLGQMHPVELEIKDTTESNTSDSYLYLLLWRSIIHISISCKLNYVDFRITSFLFLGSNIPSLPAYGI